MEIIAHRGMHNALIRQNTVSAFQKAVDLGLSELELDCRLTKDKRLVVTHGGWTIHGDKVIFVKDHTLAELIDMSVVVDSVESCKNPERQMPTIELVLKKFLGKIVINVELKDEQSSMVLFGVLMSGESEGLWTEQDLEKGLMVSSLIFKEVAAFKGLYPGVRTTVTLGANDFLLKFRSFWLSRKMSKRKIEGVDIYRLLATKETIDYFKKQGFTVRVYTVNDCKAVKSLFEWGVDGIFTDRPEIMMKELGNIRSGTA